MQITQEQIAVRIAEVTEARSKRQKTLPEPDFAKDQTVISDDLRALALNLSKENSDKLVVMYVRGEPFLSKVPKADKEGHRYIFNRGIPYGVLTAFEHNGKSYIGWSKRHPTMEDLNFTKPRARYAAVLRALTDNIQMTGKRSAVMTSGEIIPSHIAKLLASFINRASKYIDGDFANVTSAV